mgnify:FL=1
MNKSLISIGIILSLGSVGCAGLSMSSPSVLSSQLRAERGVDSLWISSEESTPQGAEPPLYAEQELGELWDEVESAEPSVAGVRYDSQRDGDLWNSAWY